MTAPTEDELLAENEHLRVQLATANLPQAPGSKASLFVGAVVGLSALAVISVVTIFVVRPDKDNTGLVTTIIGLLVPVITAFLAAAVQQVHLAVNSRLSQLLLLTQKASRAEGQLAAKAEALSAVLVPVDVVNAPLRVNIQP